MTDIYIFLVGLVITVVIGTTLSFMIAANNRAIDRGDKTSGGGDFADRVL